MFPGLAPCILNPASLRPILIPEETEDKAAETDVELHLEECHKVFSDLDAPDEEEE
jgi:hypothetical protein